ncbi:ABC transporter ATP-binding protein [Sanguibacter sp. 25GB23B1]|uniref:ABC transporter ATP-binding protein n=1 Tax=unclassified Sanguibacter TaxID=2645534 RepID=UPI0032B01857
MGPGRVAPWRRNRSGSPADDQAADRATDAPPSPGTGPLVAARGVGVRIDDADLLLPVTFDLHAGHALAVRGPNGSGKTTLLRVVAGLAEPTSGTVLVGGRPPDDRDRHFRARLAALVGPPPLARNLTLHEHLALVGASWGTTTSDATEHGHALLTGLGIDRLARRFPHELSSGQAQLFALALTLARPADILLLDEPEQRLDAERLEVVADLLRGTVDAGTALLVASHSPTFVERVADATIVLGSAEHVHDLGDAGDPRNSVRA